MSTREQLLLRMHTAYFQAGTFVVDSHSPADRLIIIVSGRQYRSPNVTINLKSCLATTFILSFSLEPHSLIVCVRLSVHLFDPIAKQNLI